MTPEQFCYWLQGCFEINDSNELTEKQVQVIRNHLNLVFEHVLDKEHDGGDKKLANKLQDIHGGTKFRC